MYYLIPHIINDEYFEVYKNYYIWQGVTSVDILFEQCSRKNNTLRDFILHMKFLYTLFTH
jgi:hypothetical protein